MKYFFLIILAFISGCASPQPKIAENQQKSETEMVITIVKSKPNWLKIEYSCPSEIVPNFEKQVNYLDEGCENKPIKCLEDCEKEGGNACYALALFVQKQKGIEVDESNPLFYRACKFGIISGCTNLAAYKLDLESKDEKYSTCAADTFEKTCKMNDSWGCTMYGMVLAQGLGRKQNFEEALKYLQKACDKFGDDDEACIGAKDTEQKILQIMKETKRK